MVVQETKSVDLESIEDIGALVQGDVVNIVEIGEEPQTFTVYGERGFKIELIRQVREELWRINDSIESAYLDPLDIKRVEGENISIVDGVTMRRDRDYLPGTGPFYTNRLRVLREVGQWQE